MPPECPRPSALWKKLMFAISLMRSLTKARAPQRLSKESATKKKDAAQQFRTSKLRQCRPRENRPAAAKRAASSAASSKRKNQMKKNRARLRLKFRPLKK